MSENFSAPTTATSGRPAYSPALYQIMSAIAKLFVSRTIYHKNVIQEGLICLPKTSLHNHHNQFTMQAATPQHMSHKSPKLRLSRLQVGRPTCNFQAYLMTRREASRIKRSFGYQISLIYPGFGLALPRSV